MRHRSPPRHHAACPRGAVFPMRFPGNIAPRRRAPWWRGDVVGWRSGGEHRSTGASPAVAEQHPGDLIPPGLRSVEPQTGQFDVFPRPAGVPALTSSSARAARSTFRPPPPPWASRPDGVGCRPRGYQRSRTDWQSVPQRVVQPRNRSNAGRNMLPISARAQPDATKNQSRSDG